MPTMSLEELADRARITDLLHTYCDLVDTLEIDRLLDLFTEDARLDMGHDVAVHGRAELRALLLDRLGGWTATSHHCTTVRFVDYDGRSATTIAYVYAFHEHPAEDRRMHLWGRYHDRLVKSSGSWRIQERCLRVTGISRTACEPLPERFERSARAPLPSE